MSPQIITDEFLLNLIYRLRWDVLNKLGVSSSVYPKGVVRDPQDAIGTHWAIISDGDLLAGARLSLHLTASDLPSPYYFTPAAGRLPPPIGSMNRLFVVPPARRHGFSAQLDGVRLAEAERLGCRSVVLFVHQLSGASRLRAALSHGFECLFPVDSVHDPLWGGFGTPLFKLL